MVTLNGPGLSRNREGGSLIFERTRLGGVYTMTPSSTRIAAAFLLRTWCQKEFEDHGLNPAWFSAYLVQSQEGTLRGMHLPGGAV